MGVSGGHDLDSIWKSAAGKFDLSKHDAVILLESARVEVFAGGAKRTTVHRVVWIGTDVGIDTHADLRVPWNSASSTFKVVKLRTWRDGRWWPDETRVSPTAVVETLPFAVALADDYSAMRETMLLHDGVEIPCVMETEYTIEETAPGPGGADGFFVLACREPAVLVEYVVDVPGGAPFAFYSGKRRPGARNILARGGSRRDEEIQMDRGDLGRARFPANRESFLIRPVRRLVDLEGLERRGEMSSSRNSTKPRRSKGPLPDTMASRLAFEPTDASKARRIASLVAEWTRPVHCDSRLRLFSLRPAARGL